MKRNLQLVFFILLTYSGSAQIIGGEIDYRCLGNGKYEVIAHLNMTCADSIKIPKIWCLVGQDTLLADSTGYTQTEDASGMATINCPNSDSCNLDSLVPRIIRHAFRGIFLLDTFTACDVTFFVREPTTNYASTTSGRNWFYIETWVNRCLAPCDASPKRTNVWPQVLIQNQDFVHYAGVTNAQFSSDSFHYSFDTARTDKWQFVNYKFPFDYRAWITFFGFPNPNLQWPPGLHLESTTGGILFRPTVANQRATMVLKVKIYRKINGSMQLVGIKHFENSMQTRPTPNNHVPKILPPYVMQICAGERKCLTITTDDDDNADSLRLTLFPNTIPNLEVYSPTAGKHPSVQICWTPDSLDVSNIPYTFTVGATDNVCPFPAQTVRAFSIFVRATPEANYITNHDSCGMVSLAMAPKALIPSLNYVWQVRDSAQQLIFQDHNDTAQTRLGTGKYYVKLRLSTSTPCAVEYTDSLDIHSDYPDITLQNNSVRGCSGNSVQIGSLNNGPGFSYKWGDQTHAPTKTLVLSDTLTVHVLKTSKAQCSRSDSFSVWGERKPVLHPWLYTCDLLPKALFAANDLGLIDSIRMNNGNDSVFYTLPESYYGPIHYKTVGNCSYSDSISITRVAPPDLSFSGIWTDDTRVQLVLDTVYSDAYYTWIINDSLRFLLPNPKIRFVPPGTQKITLFIEKDSCMFSETRYISPPNGIKPSNAIAAHIFPNPFQGVLTIEMEGMESMALFNSLGQLVPLHIETYGMTHRITPSRGIPKGIYWLRVETQQGIFMEKVVRE